jgi:hypothetical protein
MRRDLASETGRCVYRVWRRMWRNDLSNCSWSECGNCKVDRPVSVSFFLPHTFTIRWEDVQICVYHCGCWCTGDSYILKHQLCLHCRLRVPLPWPNSNDDFLATVMKCSVRNLQCSIRRTPTIHWPQTAYSVGHWLYVLNVVACLHNNLRTSRIKITGWAVGRRTSSSGKFKDFPTMNNVVL